MSPPRRQAGFRAAVDLDKGLATILSSIASLLVSSGYGFNSVNELAKISFVEAAQKITRGTAGKLSIARIAASTGLTRTEVSRLARVIASRKKRVPEPHNRAIRVADGWISDSNYLDVHGHPKRLPFSRGSANFTSLVRTYSGDIPARAMLAEMKRLKMVKHDDADVVRLVRTDVQVSRKAISAIRAISPWATFLSSAIHAEPYGDLTSTTNDLILRFESIPQVLYAIRELEQRRAAFIDGVAQLSRHSEKENNFALRITIAVAAARPQLVKRKSARDRNGS